MNQIERPKLFISYSHDSDEHRERVLGLSERLRQDGIDTILDQYVQGSPPEGWPRWMLNGLDDASHVVCVCSKNYYRRFRGKEDPDKGKGVDWEGAVITQTLYDSKSQTNGILPVLYQPNDRAFIPEPLRSYNYYLLNSEENYLALYDHVLGQAGVTPGELGELKTKPRATGVPAEFGDAAQIAKPVEKGSQSDAEPPRTPLKKEQSTVDELRAAYLARRPIIVDAAGNFHREVEDLVTESIPTARVSYEVMDWDAFHQGVRSSQYVDPLKEIPHQIQLLIVTESTGDVENARALLDSNYTVVSDEWKDGVPSPERRLICLVPPQAMPEGFSLRVDVPNQVSITICINKHLPPPRSGKEPRPLLVPHNPNAKETRALVMKGGGVKGLAYVGAIGLLQEQYSFDWFVGTSAGAIAAILLGAGYEIDELEAILREKDFTEFFDANWYEKIPNLFIHGGMNHAKEFTHWMDELLAAKVGKVTRIRLSDLPNRVTVYASRRNRGVLRFDSIDNDVDAAYAARCSMSIPFVFTPQTEQGIRTYDGGLQNNYPLQQLLKDHPDTPFVSLYLGSETYEPIREESVLFDLLSITTEGADAEMVEAHRDQTVIIDPRPIKTLDFNLTTFEKDLLVLSGRTGALAHLRPSADEHTEVRKERDALKSKVRDMRERIKRRRFLTRSAGGICSLCLLLVLLSLYFRPSPPESQRLIFASNPELFADVTPPSDLSMPGISIENRKVEIDLTNEVYVPPERRDIDKKSPSVHSYEIKAVRKNDNVRFMVFEFASQRKFMDVSCITDQPHAVWYRQDPLPLGDGFKNVWTLAIDVSQHSRGIPFTVRFRVTRWNAYQAENMNYVGHLVSADEKEITTIVRLPKGKRLKELPVEENPKLREKAKGETEWRDFRGNATVNVSPDRTTFEWTFSSPTANSAYNATIDWEDARNGSQASKNAEQELGLTFLLTNSTDRGLEITSDAVVRIILPGSMKERSFAATSKVILKPADESNEMRLAPNGSAQLLGYFPNQKQLFPFLNQGDCDLEITFGCRCDNATLTIPFTAKAISQPVEHAFSSRDLRKILLFVDPDVRFSRTQLTQLAACFENIGVDLQTEEHVYLGDSTREDLDAIRKKIPVRDVESGCVVVSIKREVEGDDFPVVLATKDKQAFVGISAYPHWAANLSETDRVKYIATAVIVKSIQQIVFRRTNKQDQLEGNLFGNAVFEFTKRATGPELYLTREEARSIERFVDYEAVKALRLCFEKIRNLVPQG